MDRKKLLETLELARSLASELGETLDEAGRMLATLWADNRPVTDFSQRDPRWMGRRYSPSGDGTLGEYGCLVTALTSLVTFAGYEVTPPDLAGKIGAVGAFDGNYLEHPSRVSQAFPLLQWHYDYFIAGRYSSYVNWCNRPAEMDVLADLLKRQPVVVEVDFNEVTTEIDQHFALALEYQADPSGGIDDVLIVMDPWTGKRANVLSDYFNPRWMRDGTMLPGQTKVSRTVTGLRVWEVLNV